MEDFYQTCKEVYRIKEDKEKFRFIDEWRNELLHCEKFYTIMSAVIINLITLILLYKVRSQDYTRILNQIWKNQCSEGYMLYYLRGSIRLDFDMFVIG